MTEFARNWTAEILAEAPLIAPARQFVYPLHVAGEEDAMNRGAMLVGIDPPVELLLPPLAAAPLAAAVPPELDFEPQAAAVSATTASTLAAAIARRLGALFFSCFIAGPPWP